VNCLSQVTLEKISKGLQDGLNAVIDRSVANLEPQVRSMFLDASTVMYGRQVTHALCVWQAIHAEPGGCEADVGLAQLKERALVGA
jgi:hypothetical protein